MFKLMNLLCALRFNFSCVFVLSSRNLHHTLIYCPWVPIMWSEVPGDTCGRMLRKNWHRKEDPNFLGHLEDANCQTC
jgi:hypothetical protein